MTFWGEVKAKTRTQPCLQTGQVSRQYHGPNYSYMEVFKIFILFNSCLRNKIYPKLMMWCLVYLPLIREAYISNLSLRTVFSLLNLPHSNYNSIKQSTNSTFSVACLAICHSESPPQFYVLTAVPFCGFLHGAVNI